MNVLSFAKASLERAVKAFAQSLAALLIADGTSLLSTNWVDRLSVSGMAAVLSILTSVASAPIGGTGPSLANEAIVPPAVDPKPDAGHADIVAVLISLACAIVAVAVYAAFIA